MRGFNNWPRWDVLVSTDPAAVIEPSPTYTMVDYITLAISRPSRSHRRMRGIIGYRINVDHVCNLQTSRNIS